MICYQRIQILSVIVLVATGRISYKCGKDLTKFHGFLYSYQVINVQWVWRNTYITRWHYFWSSFYFGHMYLPTVKTKWYTYHNYNYHLYYGYHYHQIIFIIFQYDHHYTVTLFHLKELIALFAKSANAGLYLYLFHVSNVQVCKSNLQLCRYCKTGNFRVGLILAYLATLAISRNLDSSEI
jgi:hypothetical protein